MQAQPQSIRRTSIALVLLFLIGIFRFLPIYFVPDFIAIIFSQFGFLIQYLCLGLSILLIFWRFRQLKKPLAFLLLSLSLFAAIFPRKIIALDFQLIMYANKGRAHDELFSPIVGIKKIPAVNSLHPYQSPRFRLKTGLYSMEELVVSGLGFHPEGGTGPGTKYREIFPNGWYWYLPSD